MVRGITTLAGVRQRARVHNLEVAPAQPIELVERVVVPVRIGSDHDGPQAMITIPPGRTPNRAWSTSPM